MKTIEEFIQLFAEQFDDVDATTINGNTSFREIEGWSSLVGLMTIAMVDEEFGVSLKGDDVKSSTTVEDLYNKVKSYL